MRSSKHGDGRVQIICTLGPSSYDPEVIRKAHRSEGRSPADQPIPHPHGRDRRAHQPRPHPYRCAGQPGHGGIAGSLRRGRGGLVAAGRLLDRTGRGAARGHRETGSRSGHRGVRRASRGFTGRDRLPRRRAPGHRHGRRVGSSHGRTRRGPGVEQGGGREPGGPAPAAVGKGSVGALDRATARGRPLRAVVRVVRRGGAADAGPDPRRTPRSSPRSRACSAYRTWTASSKPATPC